MKTPSNRKCLMATMLFACVLVFAAGLHAQKGGVQPTKSQKASTKPVKPSKAKSAGAKKAPTSAAASAPANVGIPAGSSIGLKVSGDWKIEAEKDEDAPKTLGGYLPAGKPAMLFFISARDPATLAAAQRIEKLEDDYAKKSVTLLAVGIGPGETLHELKDVAEQYDWDFPVVRDATQSVVRGLRARFTPEVMLIDSSGRVRYAGPIDDSWMDARKAKQHFVRNALDALLAGKKISNAEPNTGYYGKTLH